MKKKGFVGTSLRELCKIREGNSKRESSYDRTGGNEDFIIIDAGDTRTIADLKGAGIITHIWMTLQCSEPASLRKVVLKMYWDDEKEASVNVPIGDFFGLGHGETKNFTSAPLTMSPEDGRGFNCFFAMPFADGAKIEIINQCSEEKLRLYYYIDYESHAEIPDDLARFHAQWRRVNPCDGISDENLSTEEYSFGGKNKTGEDNYVILEAEGKGHYVGCHLDVHNLRDSLDFNWYGEGDDMIFIDGENFPPSIHGTGTEDYFNTAWCPQQEVCTPYHGIIKGGGQNWSGKISLYRYHIQDPIIFHKSIKVTIEHGHNNNRSDDYSSTAYWYQTEPHKSFKLSPVEERIPREEEKEIG